MNLFICLFAFLFASVQGGIYKSEYNTKRPLDVQPLHHNEQNYLQDNTEPKERAMRINEVEGPGSRNSEAVMKEVSRGVFEFEVLNRKCTFYVDERQTRRTLMCNARQCAVHKESVWICDKDAVSLTCTIKANKASCQEGRFLIDAPSRSPCPAGEKMVNAKCRKILA